MENSTPPTNLALETQMGNKFVNFAQQRKLATRAKNNKTPANPMTPVETHVLSESVVLDAKSQDTVTKPPPKPRLTIQVENKRSKQVDSFMAGLADVVDAANRAHDDTISTACFTLGPEVTEQTGRFGTSNTWKR